MATSSYSSSKKLFLFLLSIACYVSVVVAEARPHRYTSVFSFGDSLADTGNLLLSGPNQFKVIGELPYGETYFLKPTGRCSNGRLMIDFIAQGFRLPLLPPYLAKDLDYKHGVNFAVAGATAQDSAYFSERNIQGLWTNYSLNVQLNWFKELLPRFCPNNTGYQECLNNSLIFLGEIGGNDYNYAFFGGKSLDEVKAYVIDVVKVIADAAEELINLGVKELVVPGNLPIGCSTSYLTVLGSTNYGDYDRIGCLRQMNEFAEYHNSQLQASLQQLRERHHHAKIIYADYYNAAMKIFKSPANFGFTDGALRACCGAGGRYNFNPSSTCGHPDATTCEYPARYANWDGIHLTEAAYELIATGIINGAYTYPAIDQLA